MNYEQKLFEYLELVARDEASDLHLYAGSVPALRIDGTLVPVKKEKILTPQDTEGFAAVVLNEEQMARFNEEKAIDASYAYKNLARFRVNVYHQFGTIALAFRYVPAKIRNIEELNLPKVLHKFSKYRQGFVLITGPAGHGKSTTLAAIVDEINKTRAEHIITIEDPVEYIFTQERSIIGQREIVRDTPNFQRALRDSLRQDPDVIMLGEMRDIETMSTAITAAETGHLILATLHTNNAPQTINRIIDSFPPEQQMQVRAQLALSLVGIVSQRLLPRVDGGRTPATEVLIANSAVRTLIREGKVHEIGLAIETSADEGMIALNRDLANLVKQGVISMESAESYSLNAKELRALIK